MTGDQCLDGLLSAARDAWVNEPQRDLLLSELADTYRERIAAGADAAGVAASLRRAHVERYGEPPPPRGTDPFAPGRR